MREPQTHQSNRTVRLVRLAWLSSLLSATLASAQTLPAPPVSPAPVVNYEYDAQGNPTKTIQAPKVAGFDITTIHTYDTLNILIDSTNAKAGVTQFGYDGRDDLTQTTDPRNLATQFFRNGLGDVTRLVSPDTGIATHTYDAAGNLKIRTDSQGGWLPIPMTPSTVLSRSSKARAAPPP